MARVEVDDVKVLGPVENSLVLQTLIPARFADVGVELLGSGLIESKSARVWESPQAKRVT